MVKCMDYPVARRGFMKGVAAASALPLVSGAMLPRLAMAQKRGGVLRASLLGFGVVNTLDPQKAALNSDFWALTTMFSTLVKFDANMKIVGDLAESIVKRGAHTKDSSAMLPGIGGTLDLIDSILFTAPILFFYMRFVLGVG